MKLQKNDFKKQSERLGIDFENFYLKKNDNIGKTEFTQPAILL